MFNVTIVAVGAMRDARLKSAFDEFLTRIRPFAKVECVETKTEPFRSEGDAARAKEKEADGIEAALAKRKGVVWLLDERGKEFDSRAFADMLAASSEPVTFVVGGTAGFADRLKAAHNAVSLSKMTFPHELARLALAEQLYRAVTMGQKRDKYHH